jgi:nitroimidazol reductase NimA-like FMN-containing flavoprotein (pyridoxamine 5'-phosphate oxidase superfamily)
MRRTDFEVKDRQRLEGVLKKAEIGYLAFHGPDGWPRITPINFAYDGRVLWHGAIAGERFDCLQEDPRATFSAVAAQVYVPSHLLSEESAAGATVAFQSIQIRGRCQTIADPQERCTILNQLMDKYQPEGRYRKLTPDAPLYTKILNATGVFSLSVEEMTGKFKLAQNKTDEDRKKIASWLLSRGLPADRIIAGEILKTLKS